MQMINWEIDKTFTGLRGNIIRVLQRKIPLTNSALQAEVAPFCSLPTLIKASRQRETSIHRGTVTSLQFSSGSLSLGFRTDDESGACVRAQVPQVQSGRLTVWRINDKLDALQLNFDSADGWLYLQTGGDLLLEGYSGNLVAG